MCSAHIDMLSICVFTIRHWQSFGRLVHELDVCAVSSRTIWSSTCVNYTNTESTISLGRMFTWKACVSCFYCFTRQSTHLDVCAKQSSRQRHLTVSQNRPDSMTSYHCFSFLSTYLACTLNLSNAEATITQSARMRMFLITVQTLSC